MNLSPEVSYSRAMKGLLCETLACDFYGVRVRYNIKW